LNLTDTQIGELKKFGFIIGSVLIGFGLFPLLKSKEPGVHFLLLGVLFFIIAFVSPSLFSPVYKLWMRVGHLLGKINSFIILSIVFYVFFTPMSLAMKLFEKEKKFSFKIQKDSCWIKRNRENFKATMKRQF
jgi:hypothetical protein